MIALLKYLLGRLIELIMIRWIQKQMWILCAWAGYDRATIAARQTLPTKAQLTKALKDQAFLLGRRYQILQSDAISDEVRGRKLAELLADEREFLSVVKALKWATLIGRLKAEYKRRGQ